MIRRLGAAAVAAIALSGCSDGPDRPHLVLVSIDTLRWDYLGPYGYAEKHISPTVNWLAENGTVFNQAVASAGTTIPSHGTMLTGLYPRQHGARSNFHALYPETDTIARALTDAGYQTGVFTSTNIITKVGKLNRGFQADNLPAPGKPGITGPQPGSVTLGEVEGWLDTLTPSEDPIFLFLHIWEPHEPYEVTEWGDERMGDYGDFLEDGVSVEDLRQRGQEIRNSDEHVAALQALYSGEVHAADRVLGQFFENWKRRGLLDNTVVIFTADHGQGLGERKRMGHGPTHYEHVIRVPMIIADFRDPEARRIDTRVGTIDIAPTLAELAGLEPMFDWFGYSLLDPELLDPNQPYYVEVELRTERDTVQRDDPWYDPDAVGVWAGDLKLISRHDEYRLLETYTDNSFPTPVDPEAEQTMFNYLSGLIDSFRETKIDFTEAELSEETIKQLQGLGYVQ
ncbi:MAG: sulfatase [Xanthomonadales bacterium]|nr:sulfatase [Xanthomonadales bacterium]